jgi:PAS domain S-box-containing protein
LLVIFGSFGALLGGASATDASLAAHARKFSEATSAERLRLLNMVDFVPVMMLDRHGVVRFWSEGCHQLYGWSAEQAVGQSAHALLRAVASVTVDEMEAELLRTGEWSGEVCHQARNGEKLIVLAHKVLRRDTDGSRVGDNLTVIDVTTLRQTETALRASEAQFHAVVDAAADAIIIAHFDGGIHNVNPAALRIFGYDRIEELIGRDLAVLMPATDAARHAGYIANHQAGTPSRVIGIPGRQLLATRRDGTEFPIELSVGSFGLDGHQYLTGIVRDVSDRIAAEIALRDSEARLCEALKMEVVGRLAAGVAHDFNNVLQCVAGGLEMVLDNVAAGSLAHEFARIAMSSAMRGAELTHHLLAYARKQVLQPKHVDVAPFLAETRTLLSRTLGQHIAIEIRADQMLPRIHVDPGMLRTALLNLAINAAYAMPKGGTLRLDARVDSADAAFVVIAVTDTGIGMDEATLAQAFEPFFTTKGQDGTGLGLPMVQGFARQSGGEVRIESAPDQGTMIELRLPAAALAVGPVTQPDAPANLRGAGRILLVDDNPDVRVITAAFLTGVGFQVVAAANGDEALAFLVRGERFDILVTDYIMPGMNGVDLVGHVREIQPGMAALIITGFAAAADTDVLPESVTILRKPFQRPRLIEAVLRAMAMS